MPTTGLSQLPLTLAAALLAGALAAWIVRRSRDPQPLHLVALTGLAANLTTAALLQSLLVYANTTWNSVRAVVPVALAAGVPPAFPPGQGPLWANIYPPLGYVLQLPIALLPTAQSIVHAGQTLGLLMLAAPLALLLRGKGLLALWAALLAAAATLHLPGLTGAALTVHIDPPAIAFALAACLPLTAPAVPPKAAALSGALVAASVLCKQTMLPLALVLPAYLAALHSPRAAAAHLSAFLLTALLLIAVFAAFISPAGLWHNLITVPASHPWRDDSPAPIRSATLEALRSLWALWIVLPLLLLAANRPRPRAALLLLLAAFALLPASIAGYAKFGGHLNNFAYTGFFLLAANALLLASLPPGTLRRALIPVLLLVASLGMAQRLLQVHRLGPRPPLHDEAVAILQTAPGRIYLPWHPLAHFLVERRLTHQSFGLIDREKAGQTVSEEWLHAHIPPDTEVIGFDFPPRLPPDPLADHLYARLRDQFPTPVTLPGFPGWTFYARPPPPPPPAPPETNP